MSTPEDIINNLKDEILKLVPTKDDFDDLKLATIITVSICGGLVILTLLTLIVITVIIFKKLKKLERKMHPQPGQEPLQEPVDKYLEYKIRRAQSNRLSNQPKDPQPDYRPPAHNNRPAHNNPLSVQNPPFLKELQRSSSMLHQRRQEERNPHSPVYMGDNYPPQRGHRNNEIDMYSY